MRLFLFLVVGIGACLDCAAARPQSLGHCADSEPVIFQCSVGRKVVSVCVTAAGSESPDLLYAFGASGDVELVLPKSSKAESAEIAVFLNSLGDANGYIRFRAGQYAYSVFSLSARGDPTSDEDAPGWRRFQGIFVERPTGAAALLECDSLRGVIAEFDPTHLSKMLPTFSVDAELEDPLLEVLYERFP